MRRVSRWPIALATLLVLPAVLFTSASLLKYGLGVPFLFDMLGPFADPRNGILDAIITALVLLGPAAAVAVALAPIVRLRFGRAEDSVQAIV